MDHTGEWDMGKSRKRTIELGKTLIWTKII